MTSDIKNDILNLGELLLSKLEASISRFPAYALTRFKFQISWCTDGQLCRPIRQVCSFVYDQIEERFPGMGTQVRNVQALHNLVFCLDDVRGFRAFLH